VGGGGSGRGLMLGLKCRNTGIKCNLTVGARRHDGTPINTRFWFHRIVRDLRSPYLHRRLYQGLSTLWVFTGDSKEAGRGEDVLLVC